MSYFLLSSIANSPYVYSLCLWRSYDVLFFASEDSKIAVRAIFLRCCNRTIFWVFRSRSPEKASYVHTNCIIFINFICAQFTAIVRCSSDCRWCIPPKVSYVQCFRLYDILGSPFVRWHCLVRYYAVQILIKNLYFRS